MSEITGETLRVQLFDLLNWAELQEATREKLLFFVVNSHTLALRAKEDATVCEEIAIELLSIVEDPLLAEHNAREFHQSHIRSLVAREKPMNVLRVTTRHMIQAGDRAYSDAQRVNRYVRRFLEVYELTGQVESMAIKLLTGSSYLHERSMWLIAQFFRQDDSGLSLGDMLSSIMRSQHIDARITYELSFLLSFEKQDSQAGC